jgi:aldehyde dehydrogenase (NAD+)
MANGSPATPLSTAPRDIDARIEAIHQKQADYFRSGATLKRSFRERQLGALLGAIERHEKKILDALHADLHKSEAEGYVTEVGFTTAELRHTLKHLASWMRPRKHFSPLAIAPSRSYLHAQPLGQNLIIAPWNYPMQLAVAPLIGALAAGNVAVIKPSELAPATSHVVAELVADTFDEQLVAVVEGGVEVSQKLLALRWDHIFFTGGTRVGKIVAHAAADHLARCTLELGGKSPTIVMDSADLDTAAKRIVWGKYTNAGQTCVAPDYLLVHESVREGLLQRMRSAVRAFYGEDPKVSPDYGRIINDNHYRRLTGLIDKDKVVLGGDADPSQRYIAPTIMDDVTMQDKAMEDEIFGPILPVVSVTSLDQAIEHVGERPNPLALYLFSSDPSDESAIVDRVSFGGGCINNTLVHLGDPKLPFGGIGSSGIGAYHGKYSFETFSHLKSMVKTANFLDPDVKYPPYEGKLGIIRKLVK